MEVVDPRRATETEGGEGEGAGGSGRCFAWSVIEEREGVVYVEVYGSEGSIEVRLTS